MLIDSKCELLNMSDIVYGKNAVKNLLESDRISKINKVLVNKNSLSDSKIREIISLAKQNRVVVQEVPKEKLNSFTKEQHQGVLAFISPIEYTDLDDLLAKIKGKEENSLLVMLDGVQDPHNLGAIIRTAKCANADGVIIPKRRTTPVTPVVEKCSAGAVSQIPIVQVGNLNNAIDKLKDNNYWIFAAEADSAENCYDVDFKTNCVLILGGEDEGVSELTLKKADYKIKIPMLSDFNSLNVSNAASILIFEFVRQNFKNH